MTSLTLFTILKPMNDKHSVTWYNQELAMQTWERIKGDIEIIVMGNAPGVARWLQNFHPKVRMIPSLKISETGLGYVSDAFRLAQLEGVHEHQSFCNGDILLPPDFAEAITWVDQQFEGLNWLVSGGRINMRKQLAKPPHSVDWWSWIQRKAARQGIFGGPFGMDYFAYHRDRLMTLPDMLVGRWFWDTAMIKLALDQGWTVIDGAPALPIVHQFHDYSHFPGGLKSLSRGTDSAMNREHIGGADAMYPWSVADGHFKLFRDESEYYLRAMTDSDRNPRALIDF